MSHIVKGYASVSYRDKECLVSALMGFDQIPALGKVLQNAKLYRVGVGFTRESYGLVLVDPLQDKNRLGFSEERGIWQQYQEDYGSVGAWPRTLSALIQDRYLAFHYKKQTESQGFNASVVQAADGSYEVQAEEALAVW